MKIGLIDPALFNANGMPSPNLGDQIISRAVHRELRTIFGEATEIASIASHAFPTPSSLGILKGAQHIFVGGSNLLYFRSILPASWKIGPFGLFAYRNLILLGCGWGSYKLRPTLYGRKVSRLIFSPEYIHSLRDDYTRRLANEGLKIPHTLNTACPTMWLFTPEFVQGLRRTKVKRCIFSLTDYAKSPVEDAALIAGLKRHYGTNLIFWPQGCGDMAYARSLGYEGDVVERSLASFLNLIQNDDQYDYVGTRLHAGILCIEHGIRSLIIAVDNRAKEIGADTGLPVIMRGDTGALSEWIEGEAPHVIHIPLDSINAWRNQFDASIKKETE
ncbi:MAG: polysaccharide pyruvyl transferase family protein [Proteobacteria bacterium]|nr:polysaccharide pyruvyl transferase family protein [Pseudomonadota bacterium]